MNFDGDYMRCPVVTGYHDLTCSEVLPGQGQMLDLQSSTFHGSDPHSIDLMLASRSIPPTHALPSSTTSPNLPSSPVRGSPKTLPCQPTLHVEICQHSRSNMRSTRVKELVLAMLREKRTVFGELVMNEFDDPVLNDHVQSVALTDTPTQLKVW